MNKMNHKRIQSSAVTVSRQIPLHRVVDLICNAFEGGMSSCWACNAHWELRTGVKFEDFQTNPYDSTKQGSEAAKIAPGKYFPGYYLIPFAKGCVLILQDTEEEDETGKPVLYRITREDLGRALNLMAEKFTSHFNDFMDENEDAITGDIFLQLAAIGDVVYG